VKLFGVAGSVLLLSAALVAGPAVAAVAQDGDGLCTVTVQLPATAESGRPFTMSVVEDADCAGASGLQPFDISDQLTDGHLHRGYDAISFAHTPGSGNRTYTGVAPNPGTWKPLLSRLGSDPGYEVVLTTMVTTPQVTPTPTTPAAEAMWVNDTLRIAYPHVATFGDGMDEYWTVYVDGKRVLSDEFQVPGRYGAIQLRRHASAGPADVRIVATNVADYDPLYADTDTLIYSATVRRQVVKPQKGRVSAAALLNGLKVADESHVASYSAARFPEWIDADHDGLDTRAEVLKSESSTKPVVRSGTVRTGTWLSRYDGRTETVASRLAVDHLVPLQEAWTSGAAGWSAKRRTAYANDLGYGPALTAVSRSARQAKGSIEITKYLPEQASYRCAFVRSWIAVKYRWGLSIDATEKASLNGLLTLYCTDLTLVKPAKPDLTALVDRRAG
jgi:hypothetical protein